MAIKVLTLDGLRYYHGKIKALLSGKVDKVEGKQLSTEDYSTAEKTKLAGVAEGAQVNVLEAITVNGTAQAIEGKAINIDLSDYALKSDLASAVEWKGSVATVDALPGGAEKGDMYHVEEKSAEYIFDGAEWVEIGSIVDLSAYSTTEEMNAAISAAIAPKAEKTYVDEELRKVNDVINSLDIPEGVIVDSALDSTSVNAIQNGVVTQELAKKAVQADVDATIQAINTEIAKKANSADVYTKAQVDSAVGAVDAKFADYYTKTQVDSAIDADVAVVDTRITNEVATLNGAIDLKLNSADLVAITESEIDTAMA